MSIWPFLPVWPFLLVAAALCGVRNLGAGLAFLACVILVRVILYFELNGSLFYIMGLYSVLAFVVLFFVDRVAGGVFALMGVSLSLYIFGLVENRTEMIASEVVLIAGMLASAFFGPTGGLRNNSAVHPDRFDPAVHLASLHCEEDPPRN